MVPCYSFTVWLQLLKYTNAEDRKATDHEHPVYLNIEQEEAERKYPGS